MKKTLLNSTKRKLVVFLITTLGVFSNVSAQEKTFTDNDLKKRKSAAGAVLDNEKTRITKTVFYFENDLKSPVKTEKIIRELAPPDLERTITEEKTATGMVIEERLYIGDQIFVRRNKGVWRKPKFDSIGLAGPVGLGGASEKTDEPKIEITTERKLQEEIIVNKQIADCYETITTKKFTLPTGTYTETQRENFCFSKDDRYIRIEEEIQNSETKKRSLTINDFEYDPNIKIEAPKIKEK
jgi:hypothetical protein